MFDFFKAVTRLINHVLDGQPVDIKLSINGTLVDITVNQVN